MKWSGSTQARFCWCGCLFVTKTARMRERTWTKPKLNLRMTDNRRKEKMYELTDLQSFQTFTSLFYPQRHMSKLLTLLKNEIIIVFPLEFRLSWKAQLKHIQQHICQYPYVWRTYLFEQIRLIHHIFEIAYHFDTLHGSVFDARAFL